MLSIYRYMALALVVTGIAAYGIANAPSVYQGIFETPLRWVAIFAPLAFVLLLSFKIHEMDRGTALRCLLTFALLVGVSMAMIFVLFTGQSIAQTFFATAGMFLAMSLWGYTTKRDLTGWSTFLIMGLIGVIIASVTNLFLASTALQFAVGIIGVIVFAGLTALDTQRARSNYLAFAGTDHADKLAVMSALSLYLSLINLFQLLLLFTGQREGR